APIFPNYGKGTTAEAAAFTAPANAHKVPILIDPKGSDFSRYRNATLITPNISEFDAIVGPCATEEDIVRKGEALRTQLNLTALLITRSEKGMTLDRKSVV